MSFVPCVTDYQILISKYNQCNVIGGGHVMVKKRYGSPTPRIVAGGLLILLGTLLFCGASTYGVFYYCLNPSTMVFDRLVSETAHSGTLTASNETVQISLGGNFNQVRIENLWTNDTPIQFTLLDWNDTILLSLNHSGPQTWGDIVYEGQRRLARNNSNATLFINRVTDDATFYCRLITRDYYVVLGYPNVLIRTILPTIFAIIGIVIISLGFYTLIRTSRNSKEAPFKQEEHYQAYA